MAEPGLFMPLWASPPGRSIKNRLNELGLDVPRFAAQLGLSHLATNGLLDGRQEITADIAKRLSSVLGASADFWINREVQYRDDLVRVETDEWLSGLPIDEMAKLGWISPGMIGSSRASACLSFFGVDDIRTWHGMYDPIISTTLLRISIKIPSKTLAVAAWLRKATQEAEEIPVAAWSESGLRDSLAAIRMLTRRKDPKEFLPKLRELLARSGVAFVVLAPSGLPC